MGENTDMNGTRAVDEGSELDPRTAATLLEQTKRRAQHQFEFPSPLLTLIQAGAVLAAYGAIWLSVRGQNPYSGPSYGALAALYAFVAVAAIAATWEGRRANAGVIRRSSRQQWSRAIPLVAAFLAVYVLMGALRYDGFSNAIVYRILPAAGPRIVATLAALPEGDALSFTRLQNMIGLTPGNLITHLRKLEHAGYLSTEKNGSGVAAHTSVALSTHGRAALDTYTAALRDLLAGL